VTQHVVRGRERCREKEVISEKNKLSYNLFKGHSLELLEIVIRLKLESLKDLKTISPTFYQQLLCQYYLAKKLQSQTVIK